MKKVLFLGGALLFLSLSWLLYFNQRLGSSVDVTNEEILSAITRDFPAFTHEGEPVIEIKSTSRHNYSWYIASIRSKKDIESPASVKVVLEKTDEGLFTRLGPDIYFEQEELKKHRLPESVILELTE